MSSLVPALGRRFAGLLIALLVGATALPPALHADMDDLACEFGAAQSARTTHADANDTQDDSLHCEVCHWLRTVRTFDVVVTNTPSLTGTVTPVEAADVAAPFTSTLSIRASRAPPLA